MFNFKEMEAFLENRKNKSFADVKLVDQLDYMNDLAKVVPLPIIKAVRDSLVELSNIKKKQIEKLKTTNHE